MQVDCPNGVPVNSVPPKSTPRPTPDDMGPDPWPLLYIAIKRVGDGVGWGRRRGGVGGKRYGAGERRRGVGDSVGDGVGFWVCACMW